MSFEKMYGLRGPSGLNMVNQAFIIVIAYWPRRRRRRRKIPVIGRYPMGPTNIFGEQKMESSWFRTEMSVTANRNHASL